MNEMNALMTGAEGELPCPVHRVNPRQEGFIHEPGSELSADTESAGDLILDFQPLEM